MKNFKKVFAVLALFAFLGLSTSCTKQDLDDEIQQVDHKEIKRPGSGG